MYVCLDYYAFAKQHAMQQLQHMQPPLGRRRGRSDHADDNPLGNRTCKTCKIQGIFLNLLAIVPAQQG